MGYRDTVQGNLTVRDAHSCATNANPMCMAMVVFPRTHSVANDKMRIIGEVLPLRGVRKALC